MSRASSRPPGNLLLQHISRSYGAVQALVDVSLTLEPGKIHAVLGENGAGKSTLVGVLAGMVRPEAGGIALQEAGGARPLELRSPASARRAGIGVVYQQSSLVPSLSATENLLLLEPQFFLNRAAASRALLEFPELLSGLDPQRPVGELPLGLRHRLEIALVLWKQSRVLVLDEPTALLLPEEARSLEHTVQGLAAEGVAVLWVTHSLAQARRIGDRLTVLRAGRVSAVFDRGQLEDQGAAAGDAALLQALFGEQVAAQATGQPAGESAQTAAAITTQQPAGPDAPTHMLSLLGVTGPAGEHERAVSELTLTVAPGEIVGIAGVDGQGQRSLVDAATGLRRVRRGRVLLGSRDVTKRGIGARRKLGLRFLTDDRNSEGIAGSLSVAENITLAEIGSGPSWRRGLLKGRVRRAEAERAIAAFAVRPADPGARAGDLSGGNMQKVLLARELRGTPRMIVCQEPTHGLDVRTVALVHDWLRRAAQGGAGILLLSADLDELLALSDRIHVMEGGTLGPGLDPGLANVRAQIQQAMVRGAEVPVEQEREYTA